MADEAPHSVYNAFVNSPLVPMTLRVGVAGHREHSNIRVDNKVLVQQIAHLYSQILTQLKRCHNHPHARYLYNSAAPVLRLTSSMADGADRLLLEPALVGEDYELACILPFHADEYANDFDEASRQAFFRLLERADYNGPASRVLELDGDRDQADFAYRDCAETLVRNCDLLVALYDGKEIGGFGTAWTVRLALSQKIPVIWIDIEHPNHLYFLHRENGKTEKVAFTETVLHEWLGHMLLFDTLLAAPEKVKKHDLTHRILQRFHTFNREARLVGVPHEAVDFNDSGPIGLKGGGKNLLQNGFALLRRLLVSGTKVREQAAQFESNVPEPARIKSGEPQCADTFSSPASHAYYAAYLRADRLASLYASLHRSTFIFIYILGAAALIVAALAIAFSNPLLFGKTALYCAVVELVLLLMIYTLYKRDRFRRLHDRWLEYRCIAEFLRPTLYLSLFSSHFPMRRFRDSEEILGRNLLGHGGPERCWAYLYTETVLRWAGFSGHKMDDSYLQQAVTFTRNQWLGQQYHYHTQNAIAMKQMGKRLAKISELMFAATIVIVGAKIVVSIYAPQWYLFSKVCGLLAAGLPVLGTTAFAIRNHAEFEISAQRSLSTREILLGYHCRFNLLLSEPVKLKGVEEILRELTAQSITETADWLEIYEVKDTETV